MAETHYIMFLENKYSLWYSNIIKNARERELETYTEKHHIIPKCMGGSDKSSNIVKLTYREHFLCHWLLSKMTVGEDKRNMCFAIYIMGRRRDKTLITSWQYATIRKARSEAAKGRKRPDLSEWNRSGITPEQRQLGIANRRSYVGKENPNYGKKLSKESRAQLSANRKGKGTAPRSEETKQRVREAKLKYWAEKRALKEA